MEKEKCPTCKGTGWVYQTDASLGGDLYSTPPKGTYSMRYKCPRCGGKGRISKIIAGIAIAITIYLLCF